MAGVWLDMAYSIETKPLKLTSEEICRSLLLVVASAYRSNLLMLINMKMEIPILYIFFLFGDV